MQTASPLPVADLFAKADDRFHAFVSLEGALSAVAGPLCGLSYAVKDLVDVAGRAPTCGLGKSPYPVPTRTAPVIAMLDAAGAARRGFTEMTPLAYEPSGGNPYRQRPLNPWNPARICGGSSSGSAVAVAAGLVDFALGSDTAGSLRIPAHCCGVAAWKPTYGLISTEGTIPLAPSLDTIGFLARTAHVLARVKAAIAGDAKTLPVRRVAIARDCISWSSGERAVSAVERDLDALGVPTRKIDLRALLQACDKPVLTLLRGEAVMSHRRMIASGRLETTLAKRLSGGLSITDEQCMGARLALSTSANDLLELAFDGVDAILLPVLSGPTPAVIDCEPNSASFSGRTLYALSELTRFVNGLGLPAVALPALIDEEGMPVGVQIVGRKGSDGALLKLAAAIEALGQTSRLILPSLAALSAGGAA